VLQEMFLDRVRLHRKGYQHRVIKIIDKMMVDILLLADTSLPLIRKRNGKAGHEPLDKPNSFTVKSPNAVRGL
jgi:hypothetical protein